MQTIDFSATSSDPTYDVASSTWTVIEENVAIICACLPMCKGPLNRLFPSIFASGSKRASGVSGGYNPSQPSDNSSRQWAPMRGDNTMLSTRVTSVQSPRAIGRYSNSQEYMLDDTNSITRMSDVEDVRGIRKVIHYEITVQTSGGSKEMHV